MWWRIQLGALLGILFTPVAHAALPVPDRASVSDSGFLISPDTLELETGARWMEGFSAPTRLKYAVGSAFEPRFHLDMSGIDGGDPDMRVEGKFRLLADGDVSLAGMAVSALPAYTGDTWEGAFMALFSARMDRAEVCVNTGLALEGRGGDAIGVAGVPLSVQVGGAFSRTLTAFVESATLIRGGFQDWIFDAGMRLRVTDIMTVDTAAGWSQAYAAPFAQLGLSVNLGAIGG